MASTLVGLFDDRSAAESVRQELIDAGFDSSNIRLSEQEISETGTTVTKRKDRGFWAELRDFFGMEERSHYEEAQRRGGTIVAIDVADDQQLDNALDVMQRHNPVDLDRRILEWQQAGWQPQPVQTQTRAETREESIPVVEEQLRVGKRVEQRGGVRIYSRVTEQPVEEEIPLREERVTVERRPADRPAGAEAFRERTIEAREMHEEPVVSKEARVVEDVVVGREVEERTERISDTVRRTDVEIENIDDEDFRRDFQRSFATSGVGYEQVRPAYAFGRELAADERYRGREWKTIEPEARTAFEHRNPGRWEQLRDAVRYGYERAGGSSQRHGR